MSGGDEWSFLEFEAASVNSVLCTSYTGSARRRRGVGIHKEPHHEALELGRVDLPPEVARLGGVVADVGRVVDECALHASGLEQKASLHLFTENLLKNASFFWENLKTVQIYVP